MSLQEFSRAFSYPKPLKRPDGQPTGRFRWNVNVPFWIRENFEFLRCSNENDTMSMLLRTFRTNLNLVYIQRGLQGLFNVPDWIPSDSSFRVGTEGFEFL